MILTEEISDTEILVVVTANRSMSWRANMRLLLTISIFTITPAVFFAIAGYWLILPFSGLELLLLLTALYYTHIKLDRKEVIIIRKELITLEWGVSSPTVSVQVPRSWSRLSFRKSVNPFETDTLTLLVHDKRYRLGRALGKEEKQQLFSVLEVYFRSDSVLVSKSE